MGITLENVNATLEQIKRKLEAIELNMEETKTDEDIKQMADTPIEDTDQIIENAAREGIFQESHFTALIEMYEAAEQRLGAVTIKTDDSQKDAKQYVVDKIKARTEIFRGQKAKLDEATKKIDINAVEQEMQQELDSAVNTAEADIVMAEALKKLYSKLPSGVWENLQNQYNIYRLATENKERIERNPEAILGEMEENYGEDISEIISEQEKLEELQNEMARIMGSGEILTQQQEQELEQEIKEEERRKTDDAEVEDIDLFTRLIDDPQLVEKRRKLEKSRTANSRVSELNGKIEDQKQIIAITRKNLYINDRKNDEQIEINNAKQEMDAIIGNIKDVLAHSKKREFPEGFVSAMGNFLGEDGSRNYAKIIEELSVEKREAAIVGNKTDIAAKSKVVRNLKVAAKLPNRTVIDERRTTTRSESNIDGRDGARRTRNTATPPTRTSTTRKQEEQEKITMRDSEKHLALVTMTLKEKKRETFKALKKAAGKEKKKFCPGLWLKSRTKGAVEKWEKQYETVEVEKNSKEQRQEAEQIRDSVYTAFRQQMLCKVVLQPSVETPVTEEQIKSVAKNAADKQVEKEKEKLEEGR